MNSRAEFGEALSALTDLSVRSVAASTRVHNPRTGATNKVSYGTIAGWFSGTSLPQSGNPDLPAVLKVCGVEDPAEIEAWKEAVRRIRRAPKPPLLSGSSPYRGLREFEENDAPDFFGRDELVGELVQSVKDGLTGADSPVVVVVGASGSGKSSLLKAGLLDQMPDAIAITPTAEPENELKAALDQLGTQDSEQQVLIIDQCEELWTLRADSSSTRKSRERFLDRLSKWVAVPGHVLVAGLRADFYDKAIEVPLLQRGLHEDVQVLVTSMTRNQLNHVIVEPAKARGVTVSQTLVEELLHELRATDSGSDGGALPLLSHVLHETWNSATSSKKTSHELTMEDYLATGGIRRAVERSADEVYKSLTDQQQLIAQRVMIRSVVVSDESLARRRASHGELHWRDSDAEDVRYVIDRFVAARLLTSTEATVQISHESLLHSWPRLEKWIEDDRVSIMRHRRFGQEAQQWGDHGKAPDYLISRGRTEEYKQWADNTVKRWDLNALEQDYLVANVVFYQEQDRIEQRRVENLERTNADLRRWQRNAVFAFVVIAMVVVVAVVFALQANNSNRVAQRALDALVLRQAALQWQLLHRSDPALAQQVALAGYRVTTPAAVTRSALLDSTAAPTPIRVLTVEGPITSAVSTDGTLLAVANADSNVRLFRTDSPGHPPVAVIPVSVGRPYALAFRPRSGQLAVGGSQGAQLLDLTDINDPTPLTELDGATGRVENLAWSPDGSELATTEDSGTLRWKVGLDGTAATSLPTLPSTGPNGAPYPATAVAYSPDGGLVATGGSNAVVQIWDQRSASIEPVAEVPMPSSGWRVLDLAFDPRSSRLAVATTHPEALIVEMGDRANPQITQRVGGFTSYINAVAFSPDGNTVAAGSADNSVRLFDLAPDSVTSAAQILPGSAIVTSLNFLDKQLITASVDGYIRTWHLPSPVTPLPFGTTTVTLTADTAATTMIVGSRRSSQDLTPDSLALVDISDPHALRTRATLMVNPGDQSSGVATISPDGSIAAASTKTGSVYLWSIASDTPLLTAPPVTNATPEAVAALVFTPDKHYLLAASNGDSGQITVLDLTGPNRPTPIQPIDAGDRVQLLSVSTDGKYLAASTASSVRLWDISQGPHNARLIDEDTSFGNNVSAVRFATGDLLAAGSADTTVRLYRASETELSELAHLDGPTGQIQSLSFDPAGTQLAAGTSDKQIWLWNVSDPKHPTEVGALYAYDQRVNDVVFSANGDSLIAAGDAPTLRAWHINADDVADTLCARPASVITEDEWNRYLPDSPYQAPCR